MKTLPVLILRSMLGKEQWMSLQSVVKQDVFNNLTFRRLYGLVDKLHQQTGEDISPTGLLAGVEVEFANARDLEDMVDIVKEMRETEPVANDLLDKMARSFVTKSLSTQAAEYVLSHVNADDYDINKAADYIGRAVDLSTLIDSEVEEFLTAPLSRAQDVGVVRTPFSYSPALDAGIGGGIGEGEVGIVLAAPSTGKTSYLCYTGAEAIRQGRQVLHITLEIRTEKVYRRYDQALTGLSKAGLEKRPHLVQMARDSVKAAGGNLWVKDWSYANVTPKHIETLVRRMRARGQNVDTVIVDYLELLTPNRAVGRNDSIRHAYGNLGKEIRAAAVTLAVPVFTAWQVNRAGADAERLSGRDISECWDIVKHADTIIGLNQSAAELHENRMRINVIKQREDTSRSMYTLYSDLGSVEIRPVLAEDDAIVRDDDVAEYTDISGNGESQ